jgi:hypothetical protein
MKNIKIDAKYLTGSIFAFLIAYATATGFILNFIKFADVLNEIFFFAAAAAMGAICLFCSFSKK